MATFNSGPIYHYYLSMDEMQQDEVTGEGLSARVYGPVNRGSGKIEGALSFTGSRSYADLGDMSGTCIDDLQMCEYGLYFSFWVTFGRLDNGPATLLSSPSVRVYQDGTQLVANARVRKTSRFVLTHLFSLLIPLQLWLIPDTIIIIYLRILSYPSG